MTELDTHLEKLPYWENLTEAQKTYAKANASLREYKKGEPIPACQSSCIGMVYVVKGALRVYLMSQEGREVTLYRVEQGEPCVMSAACVVTEITFESSISAETDCLLLVVSSAAFKRLADENIYIRCFLYELTTRRFSAVMWTVQQILFAKLDCRLASFLISEYEKSGSPKILMTHEQIAAAIGSAREVVARMLKRFSAEGLTRSGRGEVELTDLHGLRELCS